MLNYCYKIKHSYLKSREDGRNIEEYFAKFKNEETGLEVYSIRYLLPPDTPIVKGIISMFNDHKWQKHVHLSENLADYEKEGLFFVKNENDEFYTLREDEEVLKEFGDIRICVDMDEDDNTYGYLFIVLGDGKTLYYNKGVLDDNIPDIIDTLKKEGVIYKVLSPDAKEKRKNKKLDA